MISKIIFAISVLAVMYYLPIIIFKGARGQEVSWGSVLPFTLGATGMMLFFCGIY